MTAPLIRSTDGALLRPLFLVDDLLSVAQYPAHVLTASQEFDGIGTGQAFRVADGRRWSKWTGITTNVEYSLTLAMDQPRADDMVVVDRDSVIPRLIYEVSDDNFVTPAQTVYDITLPVNPGTGHPDDALGVRTEEGAWIKRFPVRVGAYRRWRIPAMGAGLKPDVTGIHPGRSWQRARYDTPYDAETDVFQVVERSAPSGARGRGRPALPREGAIRFEFSTLEDWTDFRYHILTLFGRGAPMWILHDPAQADRAVRAIRPVDSRIQMVSEKEWLGFLRGSVPWVEHEPKEGR